MHDEVEGNIERRRLTDTQAPRQKAPKKSFFARILCWYSDSKDIVKSKRGLEINSHANNDMKVKVDHVSKQSSEDNEMLSLENISRDINISGKP